MAGETVEQLIARLEDSRRQAKRERAAAMDLIIEQALEIRDLRRRAAEDRASFDLRWAADMRAIKRWQAATGKLLTWPDHADLVVWLLGQLEKERHDTETAG